MSLLKRALRGFTQQLGDSNEKSLDASLFMMEVMHHGSKSEEIRIFENFARKCKDTLGEEPYKDQAEDSASAGYDSDDDDGGRAYLDVADGGAAHWSDFGVDYSSTEDDDGESYDSDPQATSDEAFLRYVALLTRAVIVWHMFAEERVLARHGILRDSLGGFGRKA